MQTTHSWPAFSLELTRNRPVTMAYNDSSSWSHAWQQPAANHNGLIHARYWIHWWVTLRGGGLIISVFDARAPQTIMWVHFVITALRISNNKNYLCKSEVNVLLTTIYIKETNNFNYCKHLSRNFYLTFYTRTPKNIYKICAAWEDRLLEDRKYPVMNLSWAAERSGTQQTAISIHTRHPPIMRWQVCS